jgi:cell division protein FtsZ
MKGAKGVIISITGGDDMRLMEVDEAANHIRELVDPDANIIWGSAFNNDLDGKIRVSVVATGIGAEEIMPMPQPAKVFAFPAARTTSANTTTTTEPAMEETRPITLTPPEEATATIETGEAETAETEITLDETMTATATDENGGEDEELLLDTTDTATEETIEAPAETTGGTRTWLTREETAEETAPEPRQTGTLFERMSSIARGAQKAQVPEQEETEETQRLRTGTRDPLDIPRFLNRQNNQ